MNYRKLIIVILFVILSLCAVFAQSNRKISQKEKDQLITLLNYVEYSTTQISMHKNKIVADREFDFVINRIKRDCIFDEDIRQAYINLLENLSAIKLSDNERSFYTSQAEKKRSQAIYNAFQSFGSVFVPGKTPMQMVASLAYTGVSAFFNYKNAVNSVSNELAQEMFTIDQNMIKTIDMQRTALFESSSRVLTNHNLTESNFIYGDIMLNFVEAVNEEDNKVKIKILDNNDYRKRFSLFPPYWFELGSAYQNLENYKKAIECYKHFESLKKDRVILYDKYYVELAKNMIEILSGRDRYPEQKIKNMKKNKAEIYKYLNIIEEETAKSNRSELADTNYYLAKIYYLFGDIKTAIKKLEYNIITGRHAPEYVLNSRQLLKILKTDIKDNKVYVFLNELYRSIIWGLDVKTDENFKWFENSYHCNIKYKPEPSFFSRNSETEFNASTSIKIAIELANNLVDKQLICFRQKFDTKNDLMEQKYEIADFISIGGNNYDLNRMKIFNGKTIFYYYWCNKSWNEIDSATEISLHISKKHTNDAFLIGTDATIATEQEIRNMNLASQILKKEISSEDPRMSVIFGKMSSSFNFSKIKSLDEKILEAKDNITYYTNSGNKKKLAKTQINLNDLNKERDDLIKELNNIFLDTQKHLEGQDREYIPFFSKLHTITTRDGWWGKEKAPYYCLVNVHSLVYYKDKNNTKYFKSYRCLPTVNLIEVK